MYKNICSNLGAMPHPTLHSCGQPISCSIVYVLHQCSHTWARPGHFHAKHISSCDQTKSGDSIDVNNYRPIALVTIASNIFEMILLDVMEPFIVTCANQFGFKKKHSTEHCIYALKNVTLTTNLAACVCQCAKCDQFLPSRSHFGSKVPKKKIA